MTLPNLSSWKENPVNVVGWWNNWKFTTHFAEGSTRGQGLTSWGVYSQNSHKNSLNENIRHQREAATTAEHFMDKQSKTSASLRGSRQGQTTKVVPTLIATEKWWIYKVETNYITGSPYRKSWDNSSDFTSSGFKIKYICIVWLSKLVIIKVMYKPSGACFKCERNSIVLVVLE